MSKARMVPLKPITIPCLELSAAVLSVKISSLVQLKLHFKCEMWVHNKCFLVSDNQYENIQSSNCQKYDFFNFSDSFFSDQLNLEEQNRFAPLSNDSSCGTKTCESGTNKNKFINGLKFSSIYINSIRGKKKLSCWHLISINLRLLQFKKLKLTALYQLQNCSQKLVLTMCIENIELLTAVVLFLICQSLNWKTAQFG